MQTPPVTRILLILNVLLFVPTILGLGDLDKILGLHFVLADDFRPWQLVTYMFMHGGLSHIFFNMFSLWMFGRLMEQVWGSKKFLLFYMVCGIGAGLCQEAVQFVEYMGSGMAGAPNDALIQILGTESQFITKAEYLNLWTTVGASGAVYGILLAFGMTFPNEKILLYFAIPIKAKYLVMGFIVIELISGFAVNDTVAHFAHLGGMLFGLVLILIWRYQARKKHNRNYVRWEEVRPQGKKNMWQRPEPESSSAPKHEEPKWEPADYQESTSTADPFAERRVQQAEIDRIIEKVKTSGYASLTDKEKKTIFDFRNK